MPTLEFFDRHAGYVPVAQATAAFVSFRDSLDTSDVARFPVAEFGPVNLTYGHTAQLNGTRIANIAHSLAAYGARVDSVNECRSVKGIVQNKGMFLNDVGWHIWPGNYQKNMRQINASATSVGH